MKQRHATHHWNRGYAAGLNGRRDKRRRVGLHRKAYNAGYKAGVAARKRVVVHNMAQKIGEAL